MDRKQKAVGSRQLKLKARTLLKTPILLLPTAYCLLLSVFRPLSVLLRVRYDAAGLNQAICCRICMTETQRRIAYSRT
jgi:hypothetical protein